MATRGRLKQETTIMTGTGAEVDDIQAETKRAWLHVRKPKQETTTMTGTGAVVDDIPAETKRAV